MRDGYMALFNDHGFTAIRRVRGDNYCAIRSVIHELLCFAPVNVLNAASKYRGRLEAVLSKYPGLLQRWTFAGRIVVKPHEVMEKIDECMRVLSAEACVFRREDVLSKRIELGRRLFCSAEREMMVLKAVKLLLLSLKQRRIISPPF